MTAIIIAIIAAIAEWFAPWWSAAIIAGIAGFASHLSTGKAWWAGFCGLGAMWLTVVLCRDIPNAHLLSTRMADLMFKTKSYPLYLLLTAILGALIGGLGAWSGAHLRMALKR